jgi:CheY-like chemotaxis protein
MDHFARYALVVAGSPLIRMDAQAILHEAGYRVFTVSGFEDALEILALRGHVLKLLFTEVHTPPGLRMGYDLARRCARDWPDIAIMVSCGATTIPPGLGDLPDRAVFLGKPDRELEQAKPAELQRNIAEEPLPPRLKALARKLEQALAREQHTDPGNRKGLD